MTTKRRLHDQPPKSPGKLAGLDVLVDLAPLTGTGGGALERAGQAGHHDVGQLPAFQKLQQLAVEKTAVGPHPAQAPACGQ
jgi:hypothetical protein